MRKKTVETLDMALAAARAAMDKKAEDVRLLDVRPVTYLADYFVICSGATARQVKAIADEIDMRLSAERVYPMSVEGFPDCRWVLMDYGDVVVHIFENEAREFYDLDGLWGVAPRVPVPVEP